MHSKPFILISSIMKDPTTVTKAQRKLINLAKDDLKDAVELDNAGYAIYQSTDQITHLELTLGRLNERMEIIENYRQAVKNALDKLEAVL